jgi:hypothetical protein
MAERYNWTTVTVADPCAICGHTDWCRRAAGVHMCRRVSHSPEFGRGKRKTDKNGMEYWWFREAGRGPRPAGTRATRPTRPTRPKSPMLRADAGPLARTYADNLTNEWRAALCGRLGLPAWAGHGIDGIGWRPKRSAHEPAAWTFPERAADGLVVGIATRELVSGGKKAVKGLGRGLTVPAGWDPTRVGSVLLVVEGASDVLAATASGLSAVGRPMSQWCNGDLASALRDVPVETVILVVGENDWKDKGRKCPGRKGAYQVATFLAGELGRTVHWSMVPALPKPKKRPRKLKSVAQPKDTRDYLVARAGPAASREAWAQAGAELVAGLAAGAIAVRPGRLPRFLPVSAPRCRSACWSRLAGKPETSAEGKRTSADLSCRTYRCDQCRAGHRNRLLPHLHDVIYRQCDPADGGDYRTMPGDRYVWAGPWHLGLAVLGEDEWASVKRKLQRLARYNHREVEFVRVALSDPDLPAIAPADVSQLVCIRGMYVETKCDNGADRSFRHIHNLQDPLRRRTPTPAGAPLVLVVCAVSPRQSLPSPLIRAPAAGAIRAIGAAIDDLMPPPPADAGGPPRWRPVSVSDGWRPPEEEEPAGRWRREGRSAFPAAKVRRILTLLSIRGDPDGPHGEHVLAYTTWRDGGAGGGFFSWLLSRLMDPAAAGQATPDDVADRFGRWRDFLLHNFPRPLPDHREMHRVLGPLLARDPTPEDVEPIADAAALAEVFAELDRCQFPPIPWEAMGLPPPPEPPPKRPRRAKPDEDAPPYRGRDTVRETIGR